jgi:hypothetical protein
MFLFFILIAAQQVFAQEVRENYNGARGLAMGGASIAVVNDETALLLNPAALGKLRDSYGTILDPELEGSGNLSRMYNTKAFTEPFDLKQVRDTTDYTRDTYYHAKAQLFPSFVIRNFGIGIHASRVLDAQMNTAGTELNTFYQDDVAMHLGFSLRFFDGRMKVGVVGKGISRIELNQVVDATGAMDVKALSSEGFGIGFDTGILLTAPVAWLPTLSAVVRDVGSTPFTAGSNLRQNSPTRPATIDQDIDVGFALFPIHGTSSRSSFSLQYDKIKAASEAQDKIRYAHLGYEYNYGDVFFVRAGVNQRYWTAGLELASERTQLQLTSYGEDVGVDGSPVEDRRFLIKMVLRF